MLQLAVQRCTEFFANKVRLIDQAAMGLGEPRVRVGQAVEMAGELSDEVLDPCVLPQSVDIDEFSECQSAGIIRFVSRIHDALQGVGA